MIPFDMGAAPAARAFQLLPIWAVGRQTLPNRVTSELPVISPGLRPYTPEMGPSCATVMLGRRRCQFVACSYLCAMRRSAGSCHGAALSCSPTGRPALVNLREQSALADRTV